VHQLSQSAPTKTNTGLHLCTIKVGFTVDTLHCCETVLYVPMVRGLEFTYAVERNRLVSVREATLTTCVLVTGDQLGDTVADKRVAKRYNLSKPQGYRIVTATTAGSAMCSDGSRESR
jgi:hypothetical protein